VSDIRKNDQMSWTEEALYYALKSNDLFAQLNIVLERRFRVDKEVALAAIWQTVTNSATGCGVLVEMPKLLVPQPNSQVNHLLFGAVVFEERNINWTPGTGTLHSAEYWSRPGRRAHRHQPGGRLDQRRRRHPVLPRRGQPKTQPPRLPALCAAGAHPGRLPGHPYPAKRDHHIL